MYRVEIVGGGGGADLQNLSGVSDSGALLCARPEGDLGKAEFFSYASHRWPSAASTPKPLNPKP